MKHRVLLVDDSKVVLVQLQHLLEGSEFEIVHFCQSGEAAIEEFAEAAPDLVIMDIIMPGMDGLEASRRIRQQWPESRIVVASSMVYDDVVETALGMGCKGVVEKPLLRHKVLRALRCALGES